MDVIDRNTLKSVIRGEYKFDIRNRYLKSLRILQERENAERSISWGISEYIYRYSHSLRLFYSYNHPAWPIIRHISLKIRQYLKESQTETCLPIDSAIFERYYMPEDAHPWAKVNCCVTPYLEEHNWQWVAMVMDQEWREKYSLVLRMLHETKHIASKEVK